MIFRILPTESANFYNNCKYFLLITVLLSACTQTAEKIQKPVSEDEKVLSNAMSMFSNPEITDKSIIMSEFEQACEMGNNYGCHKVGIAHNNGIHGQTKDYQQAKKWYLKAANRDYIPSQLNIANLYAHRLLPLDDETGYLWLARANKGLRECKPGSIEAESNVSDIERQRMCKQIRSFYRKVLGVFRKRMEGEDMRRIDEQVDQKIDQ